MPHIPRKLANVSLGVLSPLAQQGMVGPCQEREATPEDGRKWRPDVRTNPKEFGASSPAGLPNSKKPRHGMSLIKESSSSSTDPF